MNSANTEIERQMMGTGKSSLMMPAIIIGTEQATVTTIVRATLRIKVIAANNLDINKFFSWLESVWCWKKNNRAEFYQKFISMDDTKTAQ